MSAPAPGWLWEALPVSAQVGERRAGMQAILTAAAHAFDVSEDALLKPGRSADLILARHIMWGAMYLAGYSFPRIAQFSGHDHTSVLHAWHRLNGGSHRGVPPRPPEWLEAAHRLLEAARAGLGATAD